VAIFLPRESPTRARVLRDTETGGQTWTSRRDASIQCRSGSWVVKKACDSRATLITRKPTSGRRELVAREPGVRHKKLVEDVVRLVAAVN
jgi:hypothetical protein